MYELLYGEDEPADRTNAEAKSWAETHSPDPRPDPDTSEKD